MVCHPFDLALFAILKPLAAQTACIAFDVGELQHQLAILGPFPLRAFVRAVGGDGEFLDECSIAVVAAQANALTVS